MNIVTEKMFAKSHEKFINKVQEKDYKEANSVELVRRAVNELKSFKIEDLYKSVGLDKDLVLNALDSLCGLGEIADLGSYFIATKVQNQ